MIRAVLIGAMFCFCTIAYGQEMKCEIKDKYVCESNGCKPLPAKVWNFVDENRRTYARCDSAGCDKYDAQISQAGTFVDIDIPTRGVIAKMAIDGSTFHEVATLVHVVYVSFGSCKK